MSTDATAATTAARFARHKRITAVLMALIAVLAAVIAYLQSDASNRDNHADRDSKRYAMEAMGLEISGRARVNYDFNTAYANWAELSLLARSAAQRGDAAAAQRYTTLRDRITALSPLLAAPYFNPTTDASGNYRFATDEVDVYRYIADTYLTTVTALQEQYLAASVVKEGWDAKAGNYIAQLTLLAVALFLFGMSVMVPVAHTRWILSGAGILIAAVAAGWTVTTFAQPVDDLRSRGEAIEAYAQGAGLAFQDRWEEAIAHYDAALQVAPRYASALVGRGLARSALGDYAAAAADFEAAQAAGDASPMTAGRLAWRYYLLGRFDDAAAMNQAALAANPEELWIQYDLGLSLLAGGQIDAAEAVYADGMALAARQVAAAKATGAEPPTYLWWGLDDAVLSLEGLAAILDGGEGPPARAQIANPDQIRGHIDDLVGQLKSLATALEFTGQPPADPLTAQISPLIFAAPLHGDPARAEHVVDYAPAESVPFGTTGVAILFDYTGMQDGQRVVFKVYIDGFEEPMWRQFITWDAGASGAYRHLLTLAFSDNFDFPPGEYTVDVYVDSHLAQQGSFTVAAPLAASAE